MSSTAPIVLLAEDDQAIRDLVSYILEGEGFTVLKARHGQEALFFSQEYPGDIHLLLTDIKMPPYLDGCALANKLRQARPELRVLYMSGFVGDDSLQREVNKASVHYLPKPFTPSDLVGLVQRALEAPVAV